MKETPVGSRSSLSTVAKILLSLVVVGVLVFVIGSADLVTASDSIQGCGGFVEASASLAELRKPTDPKLDYSHMTVELHTLDGLVKDRTQCAPNGYYFLPVYDRGTFVIKIRGPDGWSFEPKEVSVVVDQNSCNLNEDINFRFTGFSLFGKVLSRGRPEGPAGVTVSISPLHEEGNESGNVYSVTTLLGGGYEFVNLPPGKYSISASHPKWSVDLAGSAVVELGWDNSAVKDLFSVAGYGVEGSVSSQGNPVLGVQFYLYSDDVAAIPCPQGLGTSSPLPKQALCHASSDVEGRFTFSAVPCGKYKLVPFYQGENTVFDVSPSSVDITVDHESVEIANPFQVTGFSIGGRVVDAQGSGVEGVKILVEDVERATTDVQGFYKLDQVTSTHYTIKASKANYKFSSLENLKVLPNMPSVPEIEATHYAVCGSINVINPTQAGKRQVALTHGPIKPQTKRANEDGSFCFEVQPGDYRLSPLTTQAEIKTGLLFTPSHLDITVNGPILDANFSQAQVSVSGEVKFKGPSSPLVTVKLKPLSMDTSRMQNTSVAMQRGEFSFKKVLPGRYLLEIRHEPVAEGAFWDDDWSWEQKTFEIDVGAEDVAGLIFVQKGYLVRVHSTHAASAFTLQENKDALPFQIEKGWQDVSLDSPGVYELGFLWPCVYFGALSFQLDTANPKPRHLVGQKYVLTGHIHIDSKAHLNANSFGDSLFVDIRQEDGTSLEVGVHLVSEANATHPVAFYKYAHWAQLGDRLEFLPRHTGGSSSGGPGGEKVLFYPKYQKVHVETDSCQPEISVFNGRPGVYIAGSVVPPLAGVNITISPQRDSEAGSLKSGEIALWTLSEEDGTFRAGPLYDDTGYSVQAMKEGFYLKSIRNNVFSVQKLGQIVVNIIPGEGAEEFLPAVLLSLSGDDGYRKNAATGSGGAFVFENLFPGSFYLRPLLKEYIFSPSAQAIEVGSGEIKEVKFSAQRFAYSVLGTVTSLSGRPEEGVSLEARSDNGYYEETTSDSEGKYRLRGLLPETIYTIRPLVKEGTPLKMERSSPSSITLKVTENDTTGVQFVIFEEAPTTILTGTVEGPNLEKWQPDILIEMVSAIEPVKVRQTVSLPMSSFFEVQGLPKGMYTVGLLALGSANQTHKFVSDAIDVDLESASQIHLGTLMFRVEERLHSQELTSAPVLPLVVGIAVIVVFISLPKLKDVYQSFAGSTWTSSPPKVKAEVRKVVGRTKRAF
ncbi:unnamed protein product [Calypogeia fissa]